MSLTVGETKTFDQLKNDLQALANPTYFIGIDVGGTNCRIICSLELGTYEVFTFKSSRVETLVDGIKKADVMLYPLLQSSPLATCLCLAGPTANVVKYKLTNYETDDNELDPSLLPQRLCPKVKTYFLNDLESGCYGLISLINHHTIGSICTQITHAKVGQTKHSLSEVYVVLAAGTGLGVGVINRRKDHLFVIPSEFGHIQIVPVGPNNKDHAEEEALLRSIIPAHDTSRNFSLEYEDIVSGRGLEACYKYYSKGGENKSGIEISKEANNSDDPNNPSVLAMLAHYRYLFKAAQELAVGLKAAAVYLIGDNIVHNHSFVDKFKNTLVSEFYSHPKKAWIENTPVYIQTTLANLNLMGTSHYARHSND